MSIKQEGTKKEQKLKSSLCFFFSAAFQITTSTFKQLYLLSLLPKLGETTLLEILGSQISCGSIWQQFGATVWEIWAKRYSMCSLGKFLQHLENCSNWPITQWPNL